MSFLKRIMAMAQFDITGYDAVKGENIVFLLQCEDEDFKTRLLANKLTASERNFLIGCVEEYFESAASSDKRLFDLAIGSFVLDCLMGQGDLPEGTVNVESLKQKCSEKKHGGGVELSKNKFNKLQPSEVMQDIDASALFNYLWTEDYYENRSRDINNLISLPEGLNQPAKIAKTHSPFRKKLAHLFGV